MSTNSFLPHVLVLPEDDANRQLAIGFRLEIPFALTRKIQVLPIAGGWLKVLDCFENDHVRAMARFPNRTMVLLIDFDGHHDRLDRAKAVIPDKLKDRVFVLGVWTEPQDLPTILGSKEDIGRALAKDCRQETDTTWGHELLRHNESELGRLRQHVRPILFQ